MRVRSRHSVGSYLIAGFALWCATVVVLVAVNANATYRRERSTTLDLLALAADAAGYAADPVIDDNVATLEDIAAAQSLDPAGCDAGLSAFRTVTESVHMHVVTAEGIELCSLRGDDAGRQPLAVGHWLETVVVDGESSISSVYLDPITREPAIRVAVPIAASGGRRGALVAVLLTGRPAVEVPKAVPRGVVLVVVDQTSGLVVNRSANAPLALGASIARTPLGTRLHRGAVVDVGGERRYFVEAAVPSTEWRVLAGLDESIALRPATRAVRRNIAIGVISLLLIGGMSMFIHRRLARSMRRLGAAIEHSWHGEGITLAPTTGPREVASVAEVFNELIVERAALEDDLRYRAMHDPLTGLRNRAGIADAVETASRVGGAVLYLDLDRFKLVNDSHGHTVGDRVLRQLAGRLVRAAGPDRLVARFGGDEFLVVVPSTCDRARASALADRLCAEVALPVELDELRLFLRGSIGIAHARPDSSSEMLVREADTAMYRAKAAGVGWAAYDEGMGDDVRRRLVLESALHGALAAGQLELHYQPIVHLETHDVVGAEALLRWNHPVLGAVSPGEFIPVAEETGLIVPIGSWVIDQAVGVAARLAAAGRLVPVSVNVSAVQFMSDDVGSRIRSALDRHGLRPELLVVEVTESTMINTAEALSALNELRDLGVGVAVDDFGTGYSSLAYLERMPATELKIDRSFVSRLDDEDASRAIVGSVIRLATNFGMAVVAEGVETWAQADALLADSCVLAQGFLFTPALPVDAFERYSTSGSTRSHRSPQSSQR